MTDQSNLLEGVSKLLDEKLNNLNEQTQEALHQKFRLLAEHLGIDIEAVFAPKPYDDPSLPWKERFAAWHNDAQATLGFGPTQTGPSPKELKKIKDKALGLALIDEANAKYDGRRDVLLTEIAESMGKGWDKDRLIQHLKDTHQLITSYQYVNPKDYRPEDPGDKYSRSRKAAEKRATTAEAKLKVVIEALQKQGLPVPPELLEEVLYEAQEKVADRLHSPEILVNLGKPQEEELSAADKDALLFVSEQGQKGDPLTEAEEELTASFERRERKYPRLTQKPHTVTIQQITDKLNENAGDQRKQDETTLADHGLAPEKSFIEAIADKVVQPSFTQALAELTTKLNDDLVKFKEKQANEFEKFMNEHNGD